MSNHTQKHEYLYSFFVDKKRFFEEEMFSAILQRPKRDVPSAEILRVRGCTKGAKDWENQRSNRVSPNPF